MQIAFSADRDALLCYCEAVMTHRQPRRSLPAPRCRRLAPRARLIRNPALSVQRDSAATVRAYARELGLTPAGRAGVVVKPGI